MTKKICLLGCTGSIGESTLQVLRDQPGRFSVSALSAHKNIDKLLKAAEEFSVRHVCLTDGDAADELKKRALKTDLKVHATLEDLVTLEDPDLVVGAVVGAAGMEASLKTVQHGIDLALANKETLIMAGSLVMEAARQSGAKVLPIDSEHSAIWQCLWSAQKDEIEKLILTASGGPFFGKSLSELEQVSVEQALDHPTWDMGPKITIDSATLMNKGLEVIEARHLFDVRPEQIDVVVHRQSLVHSLVQFQDGSMLAQLGEADMKVPIQVALDYPQRHANRYARLDLVKAGTLTFESPDLKTFPCLQLAYDALNRGGTSEAALNAANEASVAAFLGGQISFVDIPHLNRLALNEHPFVARPDIDDLRQVDAWARDHVESQFANP